MRIEFTKVQGIGNDFILIDNQAELLTTLIQQAPLLCDRHFGIGSDGIIYLEQATMPGCDTKMTMINPDGTTAICGNALRCVAILKLTEAGRSIAVETAAGPKTLTLIDPALGLVKVDMGAPILDPTQIPLAAPHNVQVPIDILGQKYHFTAVSMGNPHAVFFVPNLDFDWRSIGQVVETHQLFPQNTNTEFIVVRDRQHLTMRVWERGAGETIACGTGACAALVAAVENNLADPKVEVELTGGKLLIEWDRAQNTIFKTGPAKVVYHGQIHI